MQELDNNIKGLTIFFIKCLHKYYTNDKTNTQRAVMTNQRSLTKKRYFKYSSLQYWSVMLEIC